MSLVFAALSFLFTFILSSSAQSSPPLSTNSTTHKDCLICLNEILPTENTTKCSNNCSANYHLPCFTSYLHHKRNESVNQLIRCPHCTLPEISDFLNNLTLSMDNLALELFGNDTEKWERYRTLQRLYPYRHIDPRYLQWIQPADGSRPWTRREIFIWDMTSIILVWTVVMVAYAIRLHVPLPHPLFEW